MAIPAHEGFIDLHCHILPGIDDGADDLDMALDMARMAVEHGTSTILATPHIIPGIYNNTPESIQKRADLLREALKKNHIELNLLHAAEVRLSPEVISMAKRGVLPFINQPDRPRTDGKSFFLLEFPHQSIPPGSANLVSWLLDKEIVPLIAHPERNSAVQGDIEQLRPFMQMGCLANLTAGSFLGSFGPQAKQMAGELLQRGWGHVLGSDAHNVENRPPPLDQALDAVTAIVGHEQALAMVTTIPEFLI